jgi:ATP-binding cassette, subfamily C (CFTR/MRP), member 1
MNLGDLASECFQPGERPPLKYIHEHGTWTPEISELLAKRPNWPEHGVLEFKNVFMRYRPDTDLVLNGLSFKIEANQKVGIVGRTGAGKSTLALAISRIAELDEGQILIDGVDIAKERLHEVRSRLTVVPQDATLFTGTLRFNLDPEGACKDDEIEKLLRRAELSGVLDSDEKGLGQEIQENGANFSSGER